MEVNKNYYKIVCEETIMLKKVRILSLFGMIGILISFIGCKQEVEVPVEVPVEVEKIVEVERKDDEIPPESITNIISTNKDASVLLTWEDSISEDIFGYEVSWEQENAINRSIAPMKPNTMMVAHGNGGCIVSNLTNGINYNFTVRAMDTSGNFSQGVSTQITPSIIESSPLQISLLSSTTQIMNQDITVSVDVNTDSKSAIKTIKYKKGLITTAQVLLDDSSSIDITNTKEFEVSENGSYSVASIDTAGRREISYIFIDNIDKTSPGKVLNIGAKYSFGEKKIILTWTNPSDSDISTIDITYNVDGSNSQTVPCEKTATSYEISVPDQNKADKTYNISVQVKDKAGNVSEITSTSLTTVSGPAINAVTLDRVHISNIDTNRDIVVSISGSNFERIAEQENKQIKVRVVDASGHIQGTAVIATVDVNNNTATATVKAPVPSSPSNDGTDYRIVVNLCGTDAPIKPILNVSKFAYGTSVTLSETQIPFAEVTEDSYVDVTISGFNLDIDSPLTMQFYDSKKEPFGELVTINQSKMAPHTTKVTQRIKVPNVDDIYTLKVLFNGLEITDIDQKKLTQPTLQIYASPSFESFTIPKAGTQKEYNYVIATVKGKNFTAPGITFSLSCSTGSIVSGKDVTIVDDTTLEVPLEICGSAGEYTVTISNGANSINGSFEIKDYTDWSIGDVILKDGTRIPYDAERAPFDDSAKENAIAVIIGFDDYGVAIGLGLEFGTKLEWAKKDTVGYTARIPKIFSNLANFNDRYDDLDGTDNWEEICKVDPEGTSNENRANNYPAFNYVLTYSEKYGYTNYLEGWYLPSIAEFHQIFTFTQMSINNEIRNKLDREEFNEDIYWWTSSQYIYDDNAIALKLKFGSNKFYGADKYKDATDVITCVIRKF